jgi:uncharacterized damage-inducible protein DinB
MSTALSILQRLHQHRAWANEELVAAAASLSHEQLQQAFDIGQGSVWRSLVHMYAGEYVWLETLFGDDDPCCPGDLPGQLVGNQLGDHPIQSFDELREKWAGLEARWQNYLANLSPEMLDDFVARRRTTVSGDRPFTCRRYDVLIHVCLHAHYTEAQVINMLRHLGVQNLPDRMLTQLVWQESAGRI